MEAQTTFYVYVIVVLYLSWNFVQVVQGYIVCFCSQILNMQKEKLHGIHGPYIDLSCVIVLIELWEMVCAGKFLLILFHLIFFFTGLLHIFWLCRYHSLHHSEMDSNYCLFMPLFDALGNTLNKKSWDVHRKNSLNSGQHCF